MKILEDFPVKTEAEVQWGDMDAWGHVNNMFFFRYFENARMKYSELMGLQKMYDEQKLGAVLSGTSCRYLVPLTYPDVITTGARVTAMNEFGMTMEYFVSSRDKGLVAFGESEIVIYDYNILKKTKMPLKLKETIEKIEGKSFEINKV